MKLKINLLRSNETKTVETEQNNTIQQIIKKIGLHPDTLIVLNGKKPVPLDASVASIRELTLVEVTSGG